MTKLISIILNIISTIMTFVILACLVMYFIGIKPTIVTSGSMEPTIKVGSVCFIDTKYPLEDLKIDNIIVYKLPTQKVIHRIVEINEGKIKTQGDANEHVDIAVITKDNYYGKYLFSIEKLGYLNKELQTTTGKTIFVTVIIIIYVLQYLFNYAVKKGKNGNNK